MGDVTPVVLRRRLQELRYRMAAACARSGRDPASVRLVAVSKTMPASIVRAALEAGQDLFGENRVQEARAKIADTGPGAHWHLIGHLQTNKARQAVGLFELIHSVDDAALAIELDRRAGLAEIVQPVLLQANLAREETKHGADEPGLESLAETVARLRHLDLRGLMIIPPPAVDAESSRPWFQRLRAASDRLARHLGRPLPEISMGMSHDFEVAIEEGATLIRVGRAVFGDRS